MENDDYLLISGLQHFAFCRRQWALIHVEQQWCENALTAEGQVIHKRVHDIHSTDIRNGIITMRNLPIKSEKLKVTGCCDAVEFSPATHGIRLNCKIGEWAVCPVEYKHGCKKISDCDRLQVVAQAMCLEEMFSCEISEGAVFYHETRQKERFMISTELREKVILSFEQMHDMFNRKYTPTVKKHNGCKNCSLVDTCLPDMQSKKFFTSVNDYMNIMLNSDNDL